MKTFEQFLQEEHATGYFGTDDNMPDSFESWLENQDIAQMMLFAEAYGKECWDTAQYEEAKKHISV